MPMRGSSTVMNRHGLPGGGTKKNGPRTKITIKPFAKPPKLPENYYEETAHQILQGTRQFLQQRLGTNNNNNNNSVSSPNQQQQQQQQYSLQSAYNSTVHLVSHQFGGRLYQDLVTTLQQAAELVLVSTSTSTSSSSSSSTMQYIVAQYHIFTEYLLLCKHVLTPLDRAWQWQDATHKAVPITNSSSTSTSSSSKNSKKKPTSSPTTVTAANNTSSTNNNAYPLQTIWQVGLTCFLRRLQSLQLDQVLYQEWLQAFLQDWDAGQATDRSILQQVWYLWQDLGLLSQLSIQHDLQNYWSNVSTTWQQQHSSSSNSYPVAAFLKYCHDKHVQCYAYRPWLPVLWLWNVLDVYLVQPHLIVGGADASPNNSNSINNTTTTSTASPQPLLLQEQHLHPILQEAVFQQQQQQQQGTSHTMSTGGGAPAPTPVQILWMLAGRLQGGQPAVAAAIQKFARQQGLQRVLPQQTTTTANATTPTTGGLKKPPPPAATAAANTTAIQDLLQLQDSIMSMIQTLPSTVTVPPSGSLIGNSNYNNSSSTTSLISLKSVWEEVVNVDTHPSLAEQLAKFLDGILKSNKKIDLYQNQLSSSSANNVNNSMAGAGNTSSNNTNSYAWLQRIVSGLFVPLSAKDVFEAFYKRDLAKRLLWGRVVSMDIEKQVCSLLKAECGAGYTSKMEGMFQDIEWSRETMLVYKESQQAQQQQQQASMEQDGENKVKPVEMEVQVLTTGYWPVYPQYPNLQLPDNLEQPQAAFTKHYKTKYQGRRMTWQYALGHCMIRTTGFNKPYELVVSLCQALTLIQFTQKDSTTNHGGGWTLPELQRMIGLDDRDEMQRILQSLALGKEGTRILRKLDFDRESSAAPSAADGGKKPRPKKVRMDVDDKDKFIINNNFESNVRRIRINNILMKETKEERNKTVATVSRDRLYLIDAVLVRIMKARKTILHQQLIPQVLEQVKVPALPADVKKRIESLIEREYMERDPKDRNRYNYLA